MSDAATMSIGEDDALRLAKSENPTWLYLISCDLFREATPEESAEAFMADADLDGDGEVTADEMAAYTMGQSMMYQALLDAESLVKSAEEHLAGLAA